MAGVRYKAMHNSRLMLRMAEEYLDRGPVRDASLMEGYYALSISLKDMGHAINALVGRKRVV